MLSRTLRAVLPIARACRAPRQLPLAAGFSTAGSAPLLADLPPNVVLADNGRLVELAREAALAPPEPAHDAPLPTSIAALPLWTPDEAASGYGSEAASATDAIVALDARVFGQDTRVDLMHQMVRWQRARWRSGTAHTKNVGEISGSGKKPHAQKGTGRARAGNIRSPLRRGGAKAHGPGKHGVRDFSFKMNKRERKLALASALSTKLREGRLFVAPALSADTHRTAPLAKVRFRFARAALLPPFLPPTEPRSPSHPLSLSRRSAAAAGTTARCFSRQRSGATTSPPPRRICRTCTSCRSRAPTSTTSSGARWSSSTPRASRSSCTASART